MSYGKFPVMCKRREPIAGKLPESAYPAVGALISLSFTDRGLGGSS